MITAKHITQKEDIKKAFNIREKVYIEEQKIDRKDEFDAFDDTSEHFLVFKEGQAIGTGRYRDTKEGVKLERFAVLPEFRKKGAASILITSMLEHIKISGRGDKKLYLNAQLSAMPLYEKFGFTPEGDRFMECDIEHQKMSRFMK